MLQHSHGRPSLPGDPPRLSDWRLGANRIDGNDHLAAPFPLGFACWTQLQVLGGSFIAPVAVALLLAGVARLVMECLQGRRFPGVALLCEQSHTSRVRQGCNTVPWLRSNRSEERRVG